MSAVKATSYEKGEEWPPLASDTWRLYSMRFCPFVQRTRIVLAYKNIPYETVNVHLKRKPDWLIARNPSGLVPVLERNDTVVYESGICNDYLDELFPENPLYPRDPYKKARMRLLMEYFGKVVAAFRVFYTNSTEEEFKDSVTNIPTFLQTYEQQLSGSYFGGNELSMLDIHIWPWFERMDVARLQGIDLLAGLPRLQAWKERMQENPVIKPIITPAARQAEFMETYKTGNPNYDVGV